MHEHYYVHNGYLQDRQCKWVSSDPRRFDWGNNYLIHRISVNHVNLYENEKIFNLDDIDAQGGGRGSVLLASAAYDYLSLGAISLLGIFQPRGIREQTLNWYKKRGINLNADSELYGQLNVIYSRSLSVLSRHKITYEVV